MHKSVNVLLMAMAAMVGVGVSAQERATIGACSLLPPAEVKRIAGLNAQLFEIFPPEEEALADGGSTCTYAGVLVQLNPFSPATLERLRTEQGAAWESVAGLGDAAYFYRNHRSELDRYGELYASSGENVLTIQMDVNPPATSADDVRPAVVALAQALIDQLP